MIAESVLAQFSKLLSLLILHGVIDPGVQRQQSSLSHSQSYRQTHKLSLSRHIRSHMYTHTHQISGPEACAIYKHSLIECLHLNSMALLERKSSERIYPLAAGLDSNFRQDVWIRHFHGYGIGAFCPPVSVKL